MIRFLLICLYISFALHAQNEVDSVEQYIQEIGFRVVLDPLHKARLSAQVNYPVEKVHKKLGDSFSQGDILIQLDKGILFGYYLKANAALEKAKADLESQLELFEENIASQVELIEAESALKIAKAEVLISEKNLQAATLRAPYPGKVVDLFIQEHELPTEGEDLIEIIDDSKLVAKFLISSNLLPKVDVGTTITITINETGEEISIPLTRIGSAVDPASSTVKVEAEIDNEGGTLKAGMSGRAYILVQEENDIQ